MQRTWGLAEIRKIDGLGLPEAESIRFALIFGNNKTLAFRTETSIARAVFLWKLLQACVQRLNRAPPVQHLRLLDLQTMADNPDEYRNVTSPEEEEESTYAASEQSNLHVNSSLSELVQSEEHANMSEKSISRTHSRPATPLSRHVAQSEGTQASDPDPSPFPPGRDRVARTLSEPKAAAVFSLSEDEDMRREDERLRITARSMELNPKNLNMDERAFMAAAKRLGPGRSFEVRNARDTHDRFSSIDTDPKARHFQQRMKGAEANVAMAVAERRLAQNRKFYRLNMEEQNDLLYALELFCAEEERGLHGFGPWLEAQIQALEVNNIADILNAEKHEPVDGVIVEGDTGVTEECIYEGLIETLREAGGWLEKSESLLEPYARLAKGIAEEVVLLEQQRKNAHVLGEELDVLLKATSFDEKENSIIEYLDGIQVSPANNEFDYDSIHKAVQLLTKKASAIAKLSEMSDMRVVKEVQQMIAEKQNCASMALLPVLKKYLDVFYNTEGADGFEFDMAAVRFGEAEENVDRGLQEFLKGAECLAVCGNFSFADLIDRYVTVSSKWVADFLRFIMQEESSLSANKSVLDGRVETFVENLLYVCLFEGYRAFRLFARILDSSDRDGFISITAILRRQIADGAFIEEFFSRRATGNGDLATCIHLHLCHSLDFFAESLTRFSDQELQDLVTKVETRIMAIETAAHKRREDALSASGGIADVPSLSIPLRRDQYRKKIVKSDRVVRESVSNFLVVCREMSLSCHSLVDQHVGYVIAAISTTDVFEETSDRANFFIKIKGAVDLCSDISSAAFQGMGVIEGNTISAPKTISFCERLIASAMRSTEVASTARHDFADAVKLQCYGYIAAKLGHGEREDYLMQLAHLSARVHKHVMIRWGERAVFGDIFVDLKIDAAHRTTEEYSRFRSAVISLNALDITGKVKLAIQTVMESASETCAVLPFYEDMLVLIKERMEDVLRKARKDKAISDIRPMLLSFSRELLSNLRGELKSIREDLAGTDAAP